MVLVTFVMKSPSFFISPYSLLMLENNLCIFSHSAEMDEENINIKKPEPPPPPPPPPPTQAPHPPSLALPPRTHLTFPSTHTHTSFLSKSINTYQVRNITDNFKDRNDLNITLSFHASCENKACILKSSLISLHVLLLVFVNVTDIQMSFFPTGGAGKVAHNDK
jgi:hypothetical protein